MYTTSRNERKMTESSRTLVPLRNMLKGSVVSLYTTTRIVYYSSSIMYIQVDDKKLFFCSPPVSAFVFLNVKTQIIILQTAKKNLLFYTSVAFTYKYITSLQVVVEYSSQMDRNETCVIGQATSGLIEKMILTYRIGLKASSSLTLQSIGE